MIDNLFPTGTGDHICRVAWLWQGNVVRNAEARLRSLYV